MSSWLDLVDDQSLERFVAGGSDNHHTDERVPIDPSQQDQCIVEEEDATHNNVATPEVAATASLYGTELLVWNESTTDSSSDSNSSISSVSSAASSIGSNFRGHRGDGEEAAAVVGGRTDGGGSAGITILPSVSSSSIGVGTITPSSNSSGNHGAGVSFLDLGRIMTSSSRASRLNSISTSFVSVPRDDDDMEEESSTSSLSLHPESVESSIMTEFTTSGGRMMMISAVSDDEDDDDELPASPIITSKDSSASFDADTNHDHDDDEDLVHKPPPTTSVKESSDVLLVGEKRQQQQPPLWYNRFQSEQDWQDFREATNKLLDAVDCPLEDRDQVMAELIAQEEDLFWERTKSTGEQQQQRADAIYAVPSKNGMTARLLLEVTAVFATVAVTGVALVRLLKGR